MQVALFPGPLSIVCAGRGNETSMQVQRGSDCPILFVLEVVYICTCSWIVFVQPLFLYSRGVLAMAI